MCQRSALVHLFTALLTLACSSSPAGTDTVASDALPELESHDAAADVIFVPADTKTDPEVVFDLGELADTADANLLQCDPGEGCFLDECHDNGECQSGWCVQHLGAGVCSQTCQEECPDGWSCQQVAGTDPDLVFVCVSDFANLCRPCTTNADCTSTGGAADACIDYGPDGNFCGGPCAESECPWGFSCQEVTTVEGAALTQCVADAGTCPCTDSSVARGLSTPCQVTNEWGTCAGMRTCTEDGLTACDATIPGPESCNGLDDDCDGEVDEPDLVGGDYVNLCFDDNPCTDDACSGEQGCVNAILDGTSCDDADPCTVADHCADGVCVGDVVECDDDNPCTDDSCKPTGGCLHEPNTVPCDDDDPCTVGDHCADSACAGTAVPCDCQTDADCGALEDGDLCNGTLVCDTSALPYQCVVAPDSVVDCPQPEGPDAYCLIGVCDPADGTCDIVPANEGKLCDKTTACTYGETCQQGLCTGGIPVNCNDGNPCTIDACDAVSGCTHDLAPEACDDANPCTEDTCHLEQGCLHTPLDVACDDNNACTLDDECEDGVCVGGLSPDCDDGNLCTTDSCSAADGCVHSLNSVPCNDGDVCTLDDVCQLGQCAGTKNLVCNDANPCTDDSCHPVNGCQFVPNDAACDDGDSCTIGDHCTAGQCQAGAFAQCDDANPCTSDACEPGAGCVNAPLDGPCDDGNACTVDDACLDGLCLGGEALECDDENPCTDDSCDLDEGCQHVPNSAACDDGDVCTQADGCQLGECVGSQPLNCANENPCLDSVCDQKLGCLAVPNDAACDDGDVCTVADTCSNGGCSGVTCGQLGQLCGDTGCVSPSCHSLSFDGNDYMEVSNHTWNGELSALTIEAWVNTKSLGQAGLARIVNRHLACGAGALSSSFSLHFEGTNVLRLWVCTTESPYLVSVGADVGADLADSSWHHVAGTWDADGMSRVFVDGKSVAEMPSFGGTVGKGALPLFLAGVPPYAQHYQGLISSVRISPVVRYTQNFQAGELETDAQTLNFYPLGEGQGAVAHDAGPTGQHGEVVGATWVGEGPWNTCCVPDCEGKPCGDDGCGGSCGECPPPVQVDSVDPTEAFPADNVNATISGSGFLAGATVFFDNAQIPVLSVADTEIAVLIPAGLSPGLYDVKVTNLNGQTDTLQSGFAVLLDPLTMGFTWLASKQLWYQEVNVPWSEWSTQYANLDYAHRASSGEINQLAQAGLFQNGEEGWTTTQCVDQDWGIGGRLWMWWQGSILWANNCYPYPGSKKNGHLIWDWQPE